MQEVLQGINSDKEFEKVNSYLNALTKFTGNGYEFAYEAANLYRQLRTNGITIRKPNDCLIAMFAIKNDVMLLNDDRDFQFIAKYSPLKIYKPE